MNTTASIDFGRSIFSAVTDRSVKASDAILQMLDDDGRFIVDEGPMHDYKSEYPFSASDSYFGGILRLMLAFYNTYGGIIIFGVDDKNRSAGHNKVIVDSEKINRKLRETISRPFEVRVEEIYTKSGKVNAVIVPQRATMSPPCYSLKKIETYEPNIVYIRRGAEVVVAGGDDLDFLYGDRISPYSDHEPSSTGIASSLPQSPATIEQFVGRFLAVEKLFEWVLQSRDPRRFLWGQGGSGKSTIAYEFAHLIAQSGAQLRNHKGQRYDRVIYLSTKATYLDPYSGKMRNVERRDFDDASGLYRSILELSGWASRSEIEGYSVNQCLDELSDLLDIETQLIVIDDIDTITTAKKDSGMEDMFQLLSRSRSGSKVLYSQRGFPSFAPNAAIEVRGLDDAEFDEFLGLCCDKFKVPVPSAEEKLKTKDESERRPLAIETMIGMRRVTPSYSEAFKRWKENSGEARTYLFRREYEQLANDDRARHLLAALAIFGVPQSAETLRDVLQFSKEQIEDAVAEARDMFLTVTQGNDIEGDLYSIGSATRLFIEESSEQLNRYQNILARVNHFRSKVKNTPSAFATIIARAQRNINQDNIQDAIALLTKADLPEAFREHPEVKALLGRAYASLKSPNVADARSCFQAAFTLGYRNYEMYLSWLELERVNRTEVVNGIAICEKVVGASGFDMKTKAAFLRKLGRYQAIRASDVELTSPQESSDLRRRSLSNNVASYSMFKEIGDPSIRSSREKVEDVISISLRRAIRYNDHDAFFDMLEDVSDLRNPIPELVPLFVSRVADWNPSEASIKRATNARIHKLLGKISTKPSGFGAREEVESLVTALRSVQQRIQGR